MKKSLHFLPLLFAFGCGSNTGGQRVAFELVLEAPDTELIAQSGHLVRVTEARASLSRVDFFEGDPFLVRAWEALSPVQKAYAHPGHYDEGEAVGDVLALGAVDLLAPSRSVTFLGQGVTANYLSARVEYQNSATLSGKAIQVVGTASLEGETIPFSASISLEEDVHGIGFGADVAEGGQIFMEPRLDIWLGDINFSLIETETSSTSTGAVVLQPESPAFNAFTRGVRSTASIQFSYQEGETQ